MSSTRPLRLHRFRRFSPIWLFLSAGLFLFVARSPSSIIVAWGDPGYGALSVPPDLSDAVGIQAQSGFSLAVLQNGTVRSWGENGYPTPADLTGVKQLSGSFAITLALLSNGTVRAWG